MARSCLHGQTQRFSHTNDLVRNSKEALTNSKSRTPSRRVLWSLGIRISLVLRPSSLFILLLLLLLLSLAGAAQNRKPSYESSGVDFSRDILPIFSENCIQCHGPDEKARKAKLRFDTKEGAFRLKDGKAVIVPGKSAESELVRRITTTDPDDQMPPPKSNHKLTARQIELFTRWIDEGAKWATHWAFTPIAAPKPPAVKNARWPANDID